jgi:SNARE associated Golgi protein
VIFCEKCSDQHLGVLVFLARLLPVFSFDVISYGAGLTTLSLRTFALTTLLGMIPPSFALTYLGSRVVSAQWTLVVLGGVLVAFFMLAPKLVKRYRSSWVAQLMLGPTPAALVSPAVQTAPALATSDAARCPACGRPIGTGKVLSKVVPDMPELAMKGPGSASARCGLCDAS